MKAVNDFRRQKRINNEGYFYEKYIIVYVEGSDDKRFWECFFPAQYEGFKIHFKSSGSKQAALKYASELKSTSQTLIAVDKDHDDLLEMQYNHPRIVYTERYSIENYYFDPKILNALIARQCNKENHDISGAEEWALELSKSFRRLIIYALAASKMGVKRKVFTDKCDAFLVADTYKPNDEKINKYLLSFDFPVTLLNEMGKLLDARDPFHEIKGHFLETSVIRFVNHEIDRISGKKVKMKIAQIKINCNLIFALLCARDENFHNLCEIASQALANLELVS
jgi:hypothetical protein